MPLGLHPQKILSRPHSLLQVMGDCSVLPESLQARGGNRAGQMSSCSDSTGPEQGWWRQRLPRQAASCGPAAAGLGVGEGGGEGLWEECKI